MNPDFSKNGITLWHEDCFNVFPVIENQSIDLILADLPYGTTACAWDCILPLDELWKEYKRVIKPNGAIVLTAAQPFTWKLCSSNPEWFKYEIIWEKPNGTNPMLVHSQPFRVHESILVFYKKQPTYNAQKTYGHSTYSGFFDDSKFIGEAYDGGEEKLISRHNENTDGSRFPRSVQRFEQERGAHPTKKPVPLMAWLIRTYTNENDLVLDNTMGDGTTGVACVQEKRRFIGIEKEKEHFDKSVENVEKEIEEKRSLWD